jgi:hypothetical protein
VLERLVPAAMHGLWSMLLLGPAVRDAEARDAEHGWDLVFRGKEIRKDALVKRSPRPPDTPDPGPVNRPCGSQCCTCPCPPQLLPPTLFA